MGKTVPAYRWALEDEIYSWKPFVKTLASEEDRAAFEDMMDSCRNLAMEGGAATRPIIFEAMLMCIFLSQQKLLWQIQEELNVIMATKAGLTVTVSKDNERWK